eukprot:m51a1_g10737 putative 60S ribosomal protein L34e (119) ;mRNA; r:306636-307449
MVQRVTYRRRHSYNTVSNKYKLVRTPGNRLSVQYRTKSAKGVHCGECGCSIQGIPHIRPHAYRRLRKHDRTISRAYGANKCAKCTKERILRAFLVEEQKIVKRVMRASGATVAKVARD